jgi:hypothetical protein
MNRASHSSRFYNPHNSGWGVQIIKILFMMFSLLPCYLFLLGPNIIFNNLLSNTLSLRSSLNSRDQFSQPYKLQEKL